MLINSPRNSSRAEWGSQFFQETIFVPSDFLGSGSGACLPSFLSFLFSGLGHPMNSFLRMNVVETWFVAVWGLCWCNLVQGRVQGLVSLLLSYSVPSSFHASFWFQLGFRGLSPYSCGILFHRHFLVPSGSR